MLFEYLTSYRAGLLTLGRIHPRESLDRLALPLGYWRHLEVPWTVNALSLHPGDRVLDIGSPKLASLLAARRGAEVTAIDIDPGFIRPWQKMARAVGVDVCFEACDARRLPYPDASFDKAFSISTLEHISQDGDIAASREVYRVLKPGGIFAFTVPGRSRAVAYTERGQYGAATAEAGRYLWSRYYDRAWLQERIAGPAGFSMVHAQFYRGLSLLGWPRPTNMLLPFVLPFLAPRTIRAGDAPATGGDVIVIARPTAKEAEHAAAPFGVWTVLLQKPAGYGS